jgi:hypothetical protein
MFGVRQLPQLNEVAIVRQFMTAAEHSELLHWAQDQFAGGHLEANPVGPNRFFARYEEGDAVPDLFWELRRRAVATFSVTDYEDEPNYKCFLGCNTEGGFVHPHIDISPPGKHHLRINIMLSKPLGGGCPIVGGKMVDVEERDMWCFFPALMRHESTPVVGNRKRFVLSIGILIPRNVPVDRP